MNQSIRKIFDHIQLLLIVAVFLSGVILFISLNNNNNFLKLKNLQNQKEIINKVLKLDAKNKNLLNTKLEKLTQQLDIKTEELFDLYRYNFIEYILVMNSLEYTNDLKKLKELIKNLTDASIEYYNLDPKNKEKLQKSASSIYAHINSIIFKNIDYNDNKNTLYKLIAWFIFFITLATALWFKRSIKLIYEDDKSLAIFGLDEDSAILKSIQKQPDSNENLPKIDIATGLNNHRGMVSSFKAKRALEETDFTSITILDIDNFSKPEHKYSKQTVQIILKEVASTLSLYMKDTDIVARTDDNQFTIILFRSSESKSIDDIKTIFQSICEIEISKNGLSNITLSAGFMLKHKSLKLDEILKKTKTLMLLSRQKGGDTISYIKDLIKDDLYNLARVS
jgi:diguanylate cyclase (GGDEF)-like protein